MGTPLSTADHQPTDTGIRCHSVFEPRDLLETSSLHVRVTIPNPAIWCQIGGATYIIVISYIEEVFDTSAKASQWDFIQRALSDIDTILTTTGDRLLPGGFHEYRINGNLIRAVNANNHQMTFGVLQSSLLALRSFMTAYQIYGNVECNIYDGANWVGWGGIDMG